MTAPAFVDEAMVRSTIDLNAAGTSQYTSGTIGSNIRAASAWLERRTNRYFWDRPGETKVFSSGGRASVLIPGLRLATSVSSTGTTLTADESYWLLPDVMQTGLYTGVQLRAFRGARGGPWWLSHSDWFDRNLDSPYWNWAGGGNGSLPNDLSITGDWGLTSATYPDDLLTACRLLAAHLTVYPNAILGGGSATEQGSVNDLSGYPPFVVSFVRDWYLSSQVASVGT